MSDALQVEKTSIEGLLKIDLVVHGDNRGWFKENYQKQKLQALGFPAFDPVQNNYSFNAERGVTRGIHAEPWNKYISLACGRVFSAIVDLRPGDGFGRMETFELGPGDALYVPEGCGNSFQTLDDNVVYTYLVDAHWFPEAKYTMVNLFDEELAISWPIDRSQTIISDKDANHPTLAEVRAAVQC
jgi:dTDP-4-dehydrorhamnose 3,5-epimerase